MIFDERSSLGLVRLRVKRAAGEFDKIFDTMAQKAKSETNEGAAPTPFAEITDDDIDALFSD